MNATAEDSAVDADTLAAAGGGECVMYGKWYLARHVLLDDGEAHKPMKRTPGRTLGVPHHHWILIINVVLFIILCLIA